MSIEDLFIGATVELNEDTYWTARSKKYEENRSITRCIEYAKIWPSNLPKKIRIILNHCELAKLIERECP